MTHLGVGKFTLGLEWNCGRKARKVHICEDTFAYGSYSGKDRWKPDSSFYMCQCNCSTDNITLLHHAIVLLGSWIWYLGPIVSCPDWFLEAAVHKKRQTIGHALR